MQVDWIAPLQVGKKIMARVSNWFLNEIPFYSNAIVNELPNIVAFEFLMFEWRNCLFVIVFSCCCFLNRLYRCCGLWSGHFVICCDNYLVWRFEVIFVYWLKLLLRDIIFSNVTIRSSFFLSSSLRQTEGVGNRRNLWYKTMESGEESNLPTKQTECISDKFQRSTSKKRQWMCHASPEHTK